MIREYRTGSLTGDLSENNIGSMIGDDFSWVAGSVEDNALQIGTDNDYVDIGTSLNQIPENDFSVSLWVAPSADSNIRDFMGNEAAQSDIGFTMRHNAANQYRLIVTNGSGFQTINIGTAVSGVWAHMVLAYQVATGSLHGYLDNSLTKIVLPGGGSAVSPTNNVRIGMTDNTALSANAKLNNIAVYNRFISAGEVGSLFNNILVTSGLVAYYKLNEGIGSYVYDYNQGNFVHYTDSINGKIKSIKLEKGTNFETGSLFIKESGIDNTVLARIGELNDFSINPVSYGELSTNTTGSPWTKVPFSVNGPLEITGSRIGGSEYLNNISIYYD